MVKETAQEQPSSVEKVGAPLGWESKGAVPSLSEAARLPKLKRGFCVYKLGRRDSGHINQDGIHYGFCCF